MFENNLRQNTSESNTSSNKPRDTRKGGVGRNSVSDLADMFGGPRESSTSNERAGRIVKRSSTMGDAFANKMQ